MQLFNSFIQSAFLKGKTAFLVPAVFLRNVPLHIFTLLRSCIFQLYGNISINANAVGNSHPHDNSFGSWESADVILNTNANAVRQQGHSVTQGFPAILTILKAVASYTGSYSSGVSCDANSRES